MESCTPRSELCNTLHELCNTFYKFNHQLSILNIRQMKKTIHIPKINIVQLKKKEKNNFQGYPVFPLMEDGRQKSQNRLRLLQNMFQNKRPNW